MQEKRRQRLVKTVAKNSWWQNFQETIARESEQISALVMRTGFPEHIISTWQKLKRILKCLPGKFRSATTDSGHSA